MPDSVIDILNGCHLFADIPPESFAGLVNIGRVRTFRKGQIIFRQGQDCPGVFVVGKGLVRVYKISPGGKEHVLHLASPGQTFAEVAVLGGFPAPANAEAVVATTCALLPAESFRQLLQQDHQLCLGLLAGMAHWVRYLVGLLEDIVLRDAAGRLARYFLSLVGESGGQIALPGLKRDIAAHLNITSETLSRTLARFEEKGLIRREKNAIEILDVERLEQLAEQRL